MLVLVSPSTARVHLVILLFELGDFESKLLPFAFIFTTEIASFFGCEMTFYNTVYYPVPPPPFTFT